MFEGFTLERIDVGDAELRGHGPLPPGVPFGAVNLPGLVVLPDRAVAAG